MGRTRLAVAASVVVTALLAGSAPAAAAAGSAASAKLCRASYASVRGTGGEAFRTRGQCTSFLARGGRLAPPVSVLLSYERSWDGGSTNVTIDVGGLTGETARLRVVIGGFVLDAVVSSSEFPMLVWWSCSTTGSVTVFDTITGASGTASFDPPSDACAGPQTEPDL